MASENWHRRHALQIAAQLPDDVEDALKVLDHAAALVRFTNGQSESVTAFERAKPTLRPVS